jgi:hypothetical protein
MTVSEIMKNSALIDVGKRNKLVTDLGNAYLFISPTAIDLTLPNENDPKNTQLRTLTESVCRLATEGLRAGLPMQEIISLLRESDMARTTILTQVANKLEQFIGDTDGK